MFINQHNNGQFTAMSQTRDCVAEGPTFLIAMINCGEMLEAKDKAKAEAEQSK